MQINKIDNNILFQSGKFRLIATAVNYDRIGNRITNFKNCGKYVQEYSNPRAKELYKQGKKTKDVKEQIRLYREMGHYEIRPLSFIERIKDFFTNLF